MRILVIHQYYLLPGAAGGSRFNEFARIWSQAGHEVEVVAGNLDCAAGIVPEKYRGRWIVQEQDGSVRVFRCHVPDSYAKGYLGRSWAYAGFVCSALSALVEAKAPDVVIATSPPLPVAVPGWAGARLRFRRIPWVFEVRDLWPEGAVTTGVLRQDALLTRALYALEKAAYTSADRINAVTPAIRENIIARGLAPPDKVSFIPNGADVDLFRPGSRDNAIRRELGWGERFVVMYAGAHGRANAVQQLVDAAEQLKDRPDILLVCVGYGPDLATLEQMARERKLDNIAFYGPQPKERMPEFVNACDVGAAVLQRNPTFHTVYPNKVFDYMSCERPVLVAIDGAARKLVCDDARAGVFVEPEDPNAIAAAIRELAAAPDRLREMGRNGREYVLAHATRDALAQRYLRMLEEIVRR